MYINLLCYFLLSVYSAGVGRTGVLIAVEVAMNMIEASEPIDLMDITRKMRDQRGMMIQSPVGGRGGGGAGGGWKGRGRGWGGRGRGRGWACS